MNINRRLLYAGVFLLAIGAVLVLADLGAFDTAAIANALRLSWPLAFIALGIAVVLRRTQFSLQAGVVGAALPGLALGGAFAVAPTVIRDCGRLDEPGPATTQQGVFAGPATVTVANGCGSLTLHTASGAGWQLKTETVQGSAPIVLSSPQSLSINGSRGEEESHFAGRGRSNLDLTVPTSQINDLSVALYGARGNLDLAGAQIGRLAITSNISRVTVDASTASIGNLSAVVNVGSLSLDLPADTDLVGSLRVGGGELQICSPPGVGLHVTSGGFPRDFTVAGVDRRGSEWQSDDYASAPHHADLRITANVAGVKINPIGGCK